MSRGTTLCLQTARTACLFEYMIIFYHDNG